MSEGFRFAGVTSGGSLKSSGSSHASAGAPSAVAGLFEGIGLCGTAGSSAEGLTAFGRAIKAAGKSDSIDGGVRSGRGGFGRGMAGNSSESGAGSGRSGAGLACAACAGLSASRLGTGGAFRGGAIGGSTPATFGLVSLPLSEFGPVGARCGANAGPATPIIVALSGFEGFPGDAARTGDAGFK